MHRRATLALAAFTLAGCATPDTSPIRYSERLKAQSEGQVGDYGSAESRYGDWNGYAGYTLGQSFLDDDFGDADRLNVFGGFDIAVAPPGSPVHIVLQGLFAFRGTGPDESPGSGIEDVDNVTATQLNAGLRHYFGDGRFRPYIGGGVSYMEATFTDTSALFGFTDVIEDDESVGGWAGAGVVGHIGPSFTLGVGAQATFRHEFELVGRRFEGDGIQVLGFIGGRF